MLGVRQEPWTGLAGGTLWDNSETSYGEVAREIGAEVAIAGDPKEHSATDLIARFNAHFR